MPINDWAGFLIPCVWRQPIYSGYNDPSKSKWFRATLSCEKEREAARRISPRASRKAHQTTKLRRLHRAWSDRDGLEPNCFVNYNKTQESKERSQISQAPCESWWSLTLRNNLGGSIGWRRPKSLFKYGEERSTGCDCTHEEKVFFRFNSKWLLWQPATALEILFDSSDSNNSCSFTKQDFIFKQAYLVGLCFVLFNKQKIWQLALVYSAFYRLYLKINLPSEQNIYCHVTEIKMLKNLVFWLRTLMVFDYPNFQECLFNTLQNRNVSVKSAGSREDLWGKCA